MNAERPEPPPGFLPRAYWQSRIAELDPEVDWAEISAILIEHEFPWDFEQSLALALFRTFAVPEIGELLDRTQEFARRTQKRYDDTTVVLQEVGDFIGGESGDRTGVRRLNQMHVAYRIPQDQMTYVLSTFVVVPPRWIENFGYRPLEACEVSALVRYWQEVGRLMGIREIPEDYAGFAEYFDDYEKARFGYSTGGRRVADATLDLFASWYPRPIRPMARRATTAMMDARLRRALRYPDPPAVLGAAVRASLSLRRIALGKMAARRRRRRPAQSPRVRGYPHGWDIARVGTFPTRDVPDSSD